MQATCPNSSLPTRRLRSGCFNGSFEYLHSSSGRRRPAVNVRDNVRFGGALKSKIFYFKH